jgi:dTDP-4-amino-4,6-dideoxygalactose transaminase
VVPVASFGRAVPQAPWIEFQNATGIPVVIDGGASFEMIAADPARFIGPIPVALSFHATKSFSTAEGGCVLTTDLEMARRAGTALNFGFAGARDCTGPSTNGKMSEYHAAIGLAELDGWTEKHAALLQLAARYREAFAGLELDHRLIAAPETASCYALLRCRSSHEAQRVVDHLAAAQIETRCWYGAGLHHHRHFKTCPGDRLPATDALATTLVGLPVAPDLSEDDVRQVASVALGSLRTGVLSGAR